MASVDPIAAARLHRVRANPYLAAALWALIPRPSTKLPTLAVDRHGRLYYNPAVAEWPVEELSGVLYHEVCHILHSHHARCAAQMFQQDRWNIAADAAINCRLRDEGVRLYTTPTATPVYPEHIPGPNGLLAEEYYQILAQRQAQQSAEDKDEDADSDSESDDDSDNEDSDSKGKPGGKSKSGSKSGKGRSGADAKGGDPSAGSSPGSGSPTGGDPRQSGGPGPGPSADPSAGEPCDCGSCAGGEPRDYEDGPPSADTPGLTEEQWERIRGQVAQDIRRFAGEKGRRGDVPGEWARWADARLDAPQIPWQTKLRTAVKGRLRAGMTDYSYSRPSRRSVPGVVLPSMRARVPEVALIVDTSGSMSDGEITSALAETVGILRTVGQVWAVCCDARVHWEGQISSAKDLVGKLTGGGGTDLRHGFASRKVQSANVVVVMTDCETPWPAQPRCGRVIVVCKQGTTATPPTWCEVVHHD